MMWRLILAGFVAGIVNGQFQNPPRPVGRILEPPVPVLCAHSRYHKDITFNELGHDYLKLEHI